MIRDIDYLREHPKTVLYLRHYKDRECWLILQWELVGDERIAVWLPETGYTTEKIVLVANGGEVRDCDGNMVGTVHIPDKEEVVHLSRKEFARAISKMKLGDTLDFYDNWDGKDDYTAAWGITKVELLGKKMLLMAQYGLDGLAHLEIVGDTIATDEIEDFLEDELGYNSDSNDIYFELK